MAKVENSLRKLSEKTGFSASTISRVINHPDIVKESTRKAVFSYIEQNMIPLPQPLTVRRQVIGLTFSDASSLFTASIISALEEQLAKTSYQLLLFNLQERIDVYAYFIEHLDYLKKIDGLFITSTTLSPEGSSFFKKMGIPVVLFHSSCPGEECILTNNFKGGQDAAKYMLSRGYKSLAFVKWFPNDEHIQDRYLGFTSICPIDDEHCASAPLSAQGGYEATRKLMETCHHSPDAIFFGCDAMAAGGIRYMREHNINVNRDVGIMGFDNLPIAELMGITTMSQFVDSKIPFAVTYLLDRIKSSTPMPMNDEISITPKLVIRTSLK